MHFIFWNKMQYILIKKIHSIFSTKNLFSVFKSIFLVLLQNLIISIEEIWKNYYLHPICKQGGWVLMLCKCLFQMPIQVYLHLSRNSGVLIWGQWLEQGVLKWGHIYSYEGSGWGCLCCYQIITTNSLHILLYML